MFFDRPKLRREPFGTTPQPEVPYLPPAHFGVVGLAAYALRNVLLRIWKLRFRVGVVLAEIGLTVISFALAVYVVLDHESGHRSLDVLSGALLYLTLLRLASFLGFGVFKRSFRYASIPDFISIFKAASAGSFVFYVFTRIWLKSLVLPPALFVADWVLLQFLLCGMHFGVRIYKTQRAVTRKGGKKVVIVGAGDAGMTVLKELALGAASPCRPVAVVDDDPRKRGTTVCGVPVLGGTRDLAKVVREKHAEEVLICVPSATRSQMSRILSACRRCSTPVRTLPTLTELINGPVSQRDLRRIRIEDILERDEVHYDLDGIRDVLSDRTVLVTGAGGSIGSELCRQIAALSPRTLLLLDKSENSLFYVHREVTSRFPSLQVKPLLIDIVRADLVAEAFRNERPDIVFHTAACKHVGLLELYPEEAIRNNVLGTRNVGLAALQWGASRFVNISTDKAVRPRSYMGLSKKLAELCVQELARRDSTRFLNVRFGNVAGSTGSVLRLFWDQILKGEPLRVTDTRATRYFMSIPEAVYLILRAAAHGTGGETLVFDMGDPINIYELAKTVSLFAGVAPEKDLSIEIVGLKEGEKIEEELWEDWERPVRTSHEQILVIPGPHPLSFGIMEKIERLESYLGCDDRDGMLVYLHTLSPGFASDRERPPELIRDSRTAIKAPA